MILKSLADFVRGTGFSCLFSKGCAGNLVYFTNLKPSLTKLAGYGRQGLFALRKKIGDGRLHGTSA